MSAADTVIEKEKQLQMKQKNKGEGKKDAITNINWQHIRKRISSERDNKSRSKFVMPPHSLTNFEIPKYYQNEPKFNGVNSKTNLSKLKDK